MSVKMLLWRWSWTAATLMTEDDKGTRSFKSIRVEFEARILQCHQTMGPFGRISQSVIFILSNRPLVRLVRHHMTNNNNINNVG
jgi:hypothetical protein